MAFGLRDRLPMLATGRYAQWQSRFMRYVDTKPNGESLNKCILQGPYKISNLIILGQHAIDESPVVPELSVPETFLNIFPENKAHYDGEAKAIHLILIGIGDDIYSTVDACKIAHDMQISIKRLQQGESLNKQDEKTSCFGNLADSLQEMENQTSSNTINKNVDTSPWYKNDNQTRPFRNQRIVTVTGASEIIGSKVLHQTGIQCFNCKEFRPFAKECRKIKRAKDYSYHKEKMLLCKQAEKGVSLQDEQSDWLEDTNEEIDEQELEACYSFMAKIHEVLPGDSRSDANPLEKVQYDADYNVFSNERQHSEQPKSINDAYSNRTQDRYLGALHDKEVKLAKYKTYKDCTIENDTLELQDLKAQLQDKNIAISELKKLIEKCKGKSVETKFDKPFVVRQPNAQRIPKPSVLGKSTPFLYSLKRKSFSKTKSVTKTYVSDDLSKPVTTPSSPQTIVQLILFIVESGCTKHMTGNIKLLCNFIEKYLVEFIHINFDEIKELSKASNYDNSGPVPQLQKTSDHNHSELETHDHNNEPSSSTLVPNVSPSADAYTLLLQELDFLFSPLFKEYFSVGNQNGFVNPDHLEKVYRLRKALYGLKQAPRAWYDELLNFLMSKCFTKVIAFSNVDHAGCLDTRKSTSGGIQFLGDKLASSMSKKQDCTAMSLAEAEYVALSASCAQVMWMRTQLKDYGFDYNNIPLYCDSQLAIAISCNPIQHFRTKRIHTRYHFIKEQAECGIIEFYFVRTEYQLNDMFTKALSEVPRQTNWYEMFDSSRTEGFGFS
nr:hypothetical protein [Tanacetum cinerariifolium]